MKQQRLVNTGVLKIILLNTEYKAEKNSERDGVLIFLRFFTKNKLKDQRQVSLM